MTTHGYAGLMFMRETGDGKAFFFGVMDKPEELTTNEEMRPFVLIPGKHQTAMMLIDPGEKTDKHRGLRADQILCSPVWRTGTTEFDKLPYNIRAAAYKFITEGVGNTLCQKTS